MKHKKLFLLCLLFLIFGCTKNMKEQSTTGIDSHVKSVEKIGNIQRFAYDNSDITVDIDPGGNPDANTSKVTYRLKDKSIDAVLKITDLGNDIHLYQLLSVDNKVYYKAKINSDNSVSDFKNVNDFPFDKLSDNQHRSAKESYADCMKRKYQECGATTSCTLLCSAFPTGCFAGFNLGCIGGFA